MGVLDDHAEQIIVSPSQLAAEWAALEQRMAVFALAVASHAWLRRANLLNQYDAFAECAVTGALSSSQLREVSPTSTPPTPPTRGWHRRAPRMTG